MTATEHLSILTGGGVYTVPTTAAALRASFERIIEETTAPGIARTFAREFLAQADFERIARRINEHFEASQTRGEESAQS